MNKILQDVLSGQRDNNIKFRDLQNLLIALNFNERIKGDHFIYWHHNFSELINIQPQRNMAKGYQVKQIRKIIKKYNLGQEVR